MGGTVLKEQVATIRPFFSTTWQAPSEGCVKQKFINEYLQWENCYEPAIAQEGICFTIYIIGVRFGPYNEQMVVHENSKTHDRL